MCVNTLAKKKSVIYGNPIEMPIIRKNQFRVLMSLKLEKNSWFWQFFKGSKPLCGFSSWYISQLIFFNFGQI